MSPELFPSGLESIVQQIRNFGMIPGIWFELGNYGPLAEAYNWEKYLLQRDGIPITSGQRRFWNFRDPFVIDYLSGKVIDFIRREAGLMPASLFLRLCFNNQKANYRKAVARGGEYLRRESATERLTFCSLLLLPSYSVLHLIGDRAAAGIRPGLDVIVEGFHWKLSHDDLQEGIIFQLF